MWDSISLISLTPGLKLYLYERPLKCKRYHYESTSRPLLRKRSPKTCLATIHFDRKNRRRCRPQFPGHGVLDALQLADESKRSIAVGICQRERSAKHPETTYNSPQYCPTDHGGYLRVHGELPCRAARDPRSRSDNQIDSRRSLRASILIINRLLMESTHGALERTEW